MLSPTHDQRSQQKTGKITLQPVLINKSKFLKATWRVSELGMVISLLNARSLDYHSRDSVVWSAMGHLKFEFPFLAKRTVSFAADAKLYSTVVCLVLKRKFTTALEYLSAADEVRL